MNTYLSQPSSLFDASPKTPYRAARKHSLKPEIFLQFQLSGAQGKLVDPSTIPVTESPRQERTFTAHVVVEHCNTDPIPEPVKESEYMQLLIPVDAKPATPIFHKTKKTLEESQKESEAVEEQPVPMSPAKTSVQPNELRTERSPTSVAHVSSSESSISPKPSSERKTHSRRASQPQPHTTPKSAPSRRRRSVQSEMLLTTTTSEKPTIDLSEEARTPPPPRRRNSIETPARGTKLSPKLSPKQISARRHSSSRFSSSKKLLQLNDSLPLVFNMDGDECD